MFETNGEGQTYFAVAMKIIHRVLRTKIIQSDKNMVHPPR
jgi:ribosomal protein S6